MVNNGERRERPVLSSSSSEALRGVVPAIITPFTDDGTIDHAMLERQVGYLSDAGVHGIFACGGTGEGAYLTTSERLEILRTIRSALAADKFICAAVLAPGTQDVLEQMRAISASGADYMVAAAPFYYAMRQGDLIDHFQRVAAEAPVPLIAYNIPSATHNPLSVQTMLEIATIPNIVGMKDSSGDFVGLTRALLSSPPVDFRWFVGEDYLCGPALLCGADGVVSGLANARVEPFIDLYAAHERGDRVGVLDAQARINRLYEIIHVVGRGNPAIKAAAALAGRSTFKMRVETQSVDEHELAAITAVLDHAER